MDIFWNYTMELCAPPETQTNLCAVVFIVADPGFFLGGDAPLRNGVTDCPIPVILETRMFISGEVHTPYTLPLDLPLHYHCGNIWVSNIIIIMIMN